MEEKKNLLTYAGLKKLEEELHDLKVVKRKEVAGKIKEAREQGDLSENAEYDAAKEEQGLCEARIKDIEGKLASANVIDVSKLKTPNGGKLKVIFGATVTVVDVDTDKETTYRIVGEDEADIQANLISYKTPIAKGLLGKCEEDEIEIKIPKGTICYEIEKVEYI